VRGRLRACTRSSHRTGTSCWPREPRLPLGRSPDGSPARGRGVSSGAQREAMLKP
jgi:hypothetical protein